MYGNCFRVVCVNPGGKAIFAEYCFVRAAEANNVQRMARLQVCSQPLFVNWNNKMDWVPIVLVIFKLGVFGTGMFYAIKWHADREKEEKEKREKRQKETQDLKE